MQSAIALFSDDDAGPKEPGGQAVSPPAVPTAPPPRQYSLVGHTPQPLTQFRLLGST